MMSRRCHRVALAVLLFTLSMGTIPLADAAEQSEAYQGPCALAASADAKTLYVACADACQVAWIDLPSGSIRRRVDVPHEPTGVTLTPDQSKLIVTCAAPESKVAVLDSRSGKLLGAIPAGHTAMGPAISPDGRRLYVCNRLDNDVSVIDLAAGKEVARVQVVREPVAAGITPDGRTVFVANHLPNKRTDGATYGVLRLDVTPVVTVIDTRTLETSEIELTHGANGLRGLCVSPDGRHVLVTHLLSNFEQIPFQVNTGWINTNVVSIIDVQKRKVISTIGMDRSALGAGNPWDVAFTADGKSVCVSLAGTHQLSVIATSDLFSEFAHRTMQPMMAVWPIYVSLGETRWRRCKLPGKGPRGLAVAGSKVYAAEYFADTVAVIDPQKPEAMGAIALGPTPVLTTRRRGEMLFHDATICYQHWQSCASCHPDGRTDGLSWDLMNDSTGNPKSTKSMLLSHQTPPAMAEGVRASAEVAVRSGLTHILFADRPEEEAAAIDVYLKALRPVPSPRLIAGGLSASAQGGKTLFHDRQCDRCHPAPLYTDLKTHNVGTRGPREHNDRFDTPTLVEVWRTAPYLHDGRYTTMRQLFVEGKHGLRRSGELTDRELDDLVEFVLSL